MSEKMKLPINLSKPGIGFIGSQPIMEDGPEGPTVHFEWDSEYELPDHGVMTVEFRVKRREENVKTETYSEVVELMVITKVKSLEIGSPTNSHNGAEKAMDSMRAKMLEEESEE